MEMSLRHKRALWAGVASVALIATAGTASAGGFAVREQSASLMGSAFAGAAAGVDLSSGFWNPAAFGIAENGLSTQSAYSVIFADTEISNASTSFGGAPFPVGGINETEIDKIGVLSSTYGAYRLNEKTVLGVSVSAPFGLATQADDWNWAGRLHGRAAEMLTLNVAPSVTYEVAPGIHVAAGLQLEYMKLKIWTAAPVIGAPNLSVKADDTIGVGYTAGILIKPGNGSSIGLGFRSKIEHDLEGDFNTPLGALPANADLETPEIVTLSFVQALTDQFRALGTVEWTNWSRIGNVPVNGVPGAIPGNTAILEANWHDGWFISGGMEYDYSPIVTLRGGVAWEKSPIQDPTERLTVLPDSDRIWLSVGATYKYSESTTLDFSFAHVFFDDSHMTRDTLNQSGLILDADVENSANIISVGMRHRW
ncbi:MAG: outer membrane protein transport protein [Hyphomicrobium sp.]